VTEALCSGILCHGVSKGKLTRQELAWLLTQEAQGAADRLRNGVTALMQAPPSTGADPGGMDATLSALGDAMRMLSSLHARPTAARGQRGRIDVASLLWEVAPDARVSIEPGSGTEVFGEEAELRRMFNVMLGHGSGTGSKVAIRREGDEVAVRVVLGPDSSASAPMERAWLSRMALRYGGRYELDGSGEVLALPAEGLDSNNDVARLRKKLEEAHRQGEAFARELGATWTEKESPSLTVLPTLETSEPSHRAAAVVRLAGGIAAVLRNMLAPIGRDLAGLMASSSAKETSFDTASAPGGRLDARLDEIRRKVLVAQEFVAELANTGQMDIQDISARADLAEIVREELKELEFRGARVGVGVRAQFDPLQNARAIARVEPRTIAMLVRALAWHAIAASPRGSVVTLTVRGPAGDLGARIVVDDAGTTLPTAARAAFLALQVEPGTYGRPHGIGLFIARELALAERAELQVADAIDGRGMCVTVTFPRVD
jgi:two-component system OmpR family sensor kinase